MRLFYVNFLAKFASKAQPKPKSYMEKAEKLSKRMGRLKIPADYT